MRTMFVALALGAAALSAPAIAQSAAPDMRGTWTGTSDSIQTGATKHHEARPGDKPWLDTVQFTYLIDGQDGHRFWGTLSSKYGKEMMVGVVGRDGKSVVARTSEGEIRGVLVDPDTIELIYSAAQPATVVAVNTMKRRK